jgi:hypothetical protein
VTDAPKPPKLTPVPLPGASRAVSRAIPPPVHDLVDTALAKPGEGPAERQLAALASTGLISPEQRQALTVATTNLDVMKRVATNPGERHFGRIDLMMSVKVPTPIAQAREVLSELNKAWEGMSTDFHHFRKLFFKGKAALAKLAGKKQRAASLRARVEAGEGAAGGLEQLAVELEAEIEYDQAEIDELQHDVAVGQAKLQGKLTEANAQSKAYALICTAAGKDPEAGGFTEDDFLQEELDYYLKAAWWTASEQFKEVDLRGKYHKPGEEPTSWSEERMAKKAMRADGASRINLSREVTLFFEGMGVNQATVKDEIAKLMKDREGFAMFERGGIGVTPGNVMGYAPQDYMPTFLTWIDRMAGKYRVQCLGAYKANGKDKLKRLAALLDPKGGDFGKADAKDQGRDSVLE